MASASVLRLTVKPRDQTAGTAPSTRHATLLCCASCRSFAAACAVVGPEGLAAAAAAVATVLPLRFVHDVQLYCYAVCCATLLLL